LIGEPSIVLFRCDHLQHRGGFDGRWRYVIDIMTYARVLTETDVYCLDATLGSFRVGAHSWSAALAASQGREFRRMVREIGADPWFGMAAAERTAALARATVLAAARVAVLRAASFRARGRERSGRAHPDDTPRAARHDVGRDVQLGSALVRARRRSEPDLRTGAGRVATAPGTI
jgi:hypothetical protein